jgi:hypothetical protein
MLYVFIGLLSAKTRSVRCNRLNYPRPSRHYVCYIGIAVCISIKLCGLAQYYQNCASRHYSMCLLNDCLRSIKLCGLAQYYRNCASRHYCMWALNCYLQVLFENNAGLADNENGNEHYEK